MQLCLLHIYSLWCNYYCWYCRGQVQQMSEYSRLILWRYYNILIFGWKLIFILSNLEKDNNLFLFFCFTFVFSFLCPFSVANMGTQKWIGQKPKPKPEWEGKPDSTISWYILLLLVKETRIQKKRILVQGIYSTYSHMPLVKGCFRLLAILYSLNQKVKKTENCTNLKDIEAAFYFALGLCYKCHVVMVLPIKVLV